MNKSLLALCIAGAMAAASAAQAADVKLINLDDAGVGLNDTTPAAPVGRNPGTTRGEQAQIVYRFATDMWGGVLESSQTINIYASFAPLSCTATSGTLAQAGANWTFLLTTDKTRRYGSALADALTATDLFEYFKSQGQIPPQYQDDYGDIFSQFNGSLGSTGCLDGMSWYFGLDGNTPAGQVNFLNVVMHEIGHGLGAQGFLNKSTGALSGGYSDAYTRFAYDNVLGKSFEDMTSAERALAMRSPGRTVWTGPQVNYNASLILNDLLLLRASGSLTADYEFGTASFGAAATTANLSGALAMANDGAGADPADACEPLPAGSLAGKVAFVNRGTCGFEFKALNAQNAGATAVVIGNVATSGSPSMAPGMADDTTLTASVPTISVNLADANAIRAALPGIDVRLGTIPGRLAGADAAGRTRLYSPTTVAAGSTFSHFDTVLTPDALMEPFDSPTVQAQASADLTPGLFADIGWTLNPGNAKIGSCTTNVDVVGDGGVVSGANVQAWNNLCRSESGGNKDVYQGCMSAYKDYALASGILTGNQGGKIVACAAKTRP